MMVQVIMVGFRTKSLKTERDKMKLRIFQIDAFAENIFCGNPACVVPLKKWLPKIKLDRKVFVSKKITRDEAVKQLKEAKEMLDMGILTKDEYDSLSKKLKPIIMGN